MNQFHCKKLLYLFLGVTFFLLTTPLFAEEPDLAPTALPEKIDSFQSCALTALRRVPQLQRSKMEIEISRLGEDDSRWSLFPDLTLSTYYYFAQQEGNVSIHANNYRPWEPYYSLKAQKMITHIVMLKHLEATAAALHKLADTFLQLIVTDENEIHYSQMQQLAAKRLQFVKNRVTNGTSTPLELEFEEQRHHYIGVESEANSIKRETLLRGLCVMLDLTDPSIFQLNNQVLLQQILGPYIPPGITPPEQAENSIRQQVARIKEQLQKKKITLAYSKFVPDILVGFRSPDVLNVSVNDDQDYYFYSGISLTLWDGQKRSRDITRQKLVLRQMQLEKKEIDNSEAIEWMRATQQYVAEKSKYSLAQSMEKLKSIELKRKRYEYNNGLIELPELIHHQIAHHREQLTTIQKGLSLQRAGLALRHLSGQLVKDTLNISIADINNE